MAQLAGIVPTEAAVEPEVVPEVTLAPADEAAPDGSLTPDGPEPEGEPVELAPDADPFDVPLLELDPADEVDPADALDPADELDPATDVEPESDVLSLEPDGAPVPAEPPLAHAADAT